MLKLTIEHEGEDRKLIVYANTMEVLIDNVLPPWLPKLEEDLPSLRTTHRFRKDPTGEEKKERKSGWYYDCE